MPRRGSASVAREEARGEAHERGARELGVVVERDARALDPEAVELRERGREARLDGGARATRERVERVDQRQGGRGHRLSGRAILGALPRGR